MIVTADTPLKLPVLWIVTEGMAGTENQCRGIAEALQLEPVIKKMQLAQPWKTLSPYLGMECAASFTDAKALREGPVPDIILGSGRKAIAAMRWLKKTAPKGHTPLLVQVQDPRFARAEFDAIIAAQHDPASGGNVFHTQGTPNRITDAMLATAAAKWNETLGHLPHPRVAVVIGGNSRAYTLEGARTHQLVKLIKPLLDQGASLMMTISRRTPPESRAVLAKNFGNRPDVFFWDGTGDNPYMGMLALADYIMVTADSTAMLSDAGSTGKPVYILPLNGGHYRIEKFHAYLLEKGIARWFIGKLDAPWQYPAMRDAEAAAQYIRGLLTARGFTLPPSPLT